MRASEIEAIRNGTTLFFISDDDEITKGKLRKGEEDYESGTTFYCLSKGKYNLIFRMAEDIYATFEEAKKVLVSKVKALLEKVKNQTEAK